MRAFAEALDSVPMALAENSGLSPIETLASVKSRHVKEKNSRLGIDCMQTGSNGTFDYNICWAQMLHGKEMVSALLLGRLYLSNFISFFFFQFFTQYLQHNRPSPLFFLPHGHSQCTSTITFEV